MVAERFIARHAREVSPSLIQPVRELSQLARELINNERESSLGIKRVFVLSERNKRLYQVADVYGEDDPEFIVGNFVIGGFQYLPDGYPEAQLRDLYIPRNTNLIIPEQITNLKGVSVREVRKLTNDLRSGAKVDGFEVYTKTEAYLRNVISTTSKTESDDL